MAVIHEMMIQILGTHAFKEPV